MHDADAIGSGDQLDPAIQMAFRRAGTAAAPAFLGFGTWVNHMVAELEIDRVFLLSREGPFLGRVLKATGVPAELLVELEVSRLATILPSIDEFEVDALMRIWERFPNMSTRALMSSLALDVAEVDRVVRHHGLDPDVVIQQPWSDQRVMAVLADPDFLATAHRERDRSRELLLSYLQQHGLHNAGRHAFVDVGWRGTIQDSLSVLLPEIRSVGLLLAHRPADLAQPANSEKHGFLAGVDRGGQRFGQEIRLAASPLEMLTCGTGGTTTGYEEERGLVQAIRRVDRDEESILASEVAQFQAAVVDALDDGTGSASPDRHASAAALKSVLFDPTAELMSTYDRFNFDASVGGRDGSSSGLRFVGEAVVRPAALKERIQEHGWPHAVAKRTLGGRGFAALSKVLSTTKRGAKWVA